MDHIEITEANGRESFERLYDEYYDKVYIYIFRRVNHQHTAEDLTAEVFLKAFAHPYNPQLAKFSTYIYTIAANMLKNQYRAVSKNSGIVSSEELEENFIDDTDIPGELITQEEYTRLKTVLAALPERQYTVIYRRYYLEQSFKEIGRALGVTEAYTRKIHERALADLKKRLTDVTFHRFMCINNQKVVAGDTAEQKALQ